MGPDPVAIRRLLLAFDLNTLFREELGWDRLRQSYDIPIGGHAFRLEGVAEKRGFQVFLCRADAMPTRDQRVKLDRDLSKLAFEHLLIFADQRLTTQTWQWTRRERGRPNVPREATLRIGQTGELLAQKVAQLAIAIDQEDELTLPGVTGLVKAAFDVDKVTKKFYERFRTEHSKFLAFVSGIQAQADREWYASLMLNRLMFVYFIQKRGFLDGDLNYLQSRLKKIQVQQGTGRFLSFYREFLLRLFHEGLGQQPSTRPADFDDLLGIIPYVNGGLFEFHQIELDNPSIQIPDEAFERLFDFFDDYDWHLDQRELAKDNEINPDVLGYIFEKYINQKQMGAYYTKEDITGYIARNTVIPFLFDAARKECAIAFRPDGAIWSLLREDPDRYIHEPVRRGVDVPLPDHIAAGIEDIGARGGWNRPADPAYALPTETWREHVARRTRCLDLRARLAGGQITSIDDLITENLDIERLARDAIDGAEGPEILLAFWKALNEITILDPTCGSGAFLFAALNILEPLYEACLTGMGAFLDALDRSGERHSPERLRPFRDALAEVARHPNRAYFILKSIILNNLYGVDIMDEAVEICKLRLFLKLVAQVGSAADVEPLPDIDFNIRAGNTLVGFASYEEVQTAVLGGTQGKMDLDGSMQRIDEQAEFAHRAFRHFREIQTQPSFDAADLAKAKLHVREQLSSLANELDRYLAEEAGISPAQDESFAIWRSAQQPFHWFVEFYGIMKNGGFDVTVGNPPYVEIDPSATPYRLAAYATLSCRNLFALVFERSAKLVRTRGRVGLIVPVSFASAGAFEPLRKEVRRVSADLWTSHFANRPGQLFAGAQNRLTIALMTRGAGGGGVRSTAYKRWDAKGGERDILFPLLRYVEVPGDLLRAGLPKIGTSEAASILRKLSGPRLRVWVARGGQWPIYWPRVPGYFCQFFMKPPIARPENGAPRIRGEVNAIAAPSEALQHALFCILNSTTYYLYFCATTDGRHINPSDVLDFPLDVARLESSLVARLGVISVRLQQAMDANTSQWRKSGLLIDSVDSAACKPHIDAIDAALGEHYGFTPAELEYVLTYDLKYRMSLPAESGGDNGN